MRGASDLHMKRDERGRRLGGEWDKRLERRGDAVVALLDERGHDLANTAIARTETGTTTTGYASRRMRLSSTRRSRLHRRRHAERAFSMPNQGTLERFEKVRVR